MLLDNSASRFAREPWCANHEFSPVDIIPTWLTMLMYQALESTIGPMWSQIIITTFFFRRKETHETHLKP
jgi:hypothetical protein